MNANEIVKKIRAAILVVGVSVDSRRLCKGTRPHRHKAPGNGGHNTCGGQAHRHTGTDTSAGA